MEKPSLWHEGRRVGLPASVYGVEDMTLESVDPEVYGLVAELNEAGLHTLGSCSGHGVEDGWVLFPRRLSSGERFAAKLVARRLAFVGVRVEDGSHLQKPVSFLVFDSP